MKKLFVILGTVGFLLAADLNDSPGVNEHFDTVSEVLVALRDDTITEHLQDTTLEKVSSEIGYAIVHEGRALLPNGRKGKRVSKHFECIACHNTVREDPEPTISDPEARLEYAIQHNLPFLQGTTFYGIFSRRSFYNGDYENKYGELVESARGDLRQAIQLCATECSQGRLLKEWELESVLAYFRDLDVPLSDLHLTPNENELIMKAVTDSKNQQEAINLINNKIMTASPATFAAPPENRKMGNNLVGRPHIGEQIYKLSCLYCHADEKYSFLYLDTTPLQRRFLASEIEDYSNHSIYQVIRYGTSPVAGKKAYMPNYPLERMSRQQVEDLRAYLEEVL